MIGSTRVYGLTGGIASGKSLAADFFRDAGFAVLDADTIARQLTEPKGAAHEAVLKRFGTDDRAELRKLIFSDEQARKDLEAILHPLIWEESKRRIAGLNVPAVIYEGALLVESGRYKELDGLIVIDAFRDVRRNRLIKRDNIDARHAEAILNAQASDEARRKAATVVVENFSTPEELRRKILTLAATLR